MGGPSVPPSSSSGAVNGSQSSRSQPSQQITHKVPVMVLLLILLVSGTFWQVNRSVQSFVPNLYDNKNGDEPTNADRSSDHSDYNRPWNTDLEAPVTSDATKLLREASHRAKQEDANEMNDRGSTATTDSEAEQKKVQQNGEEEKSPTIKSEQEVSDQKQKPLNVIIFYPDDWRHDSIGGVAPVVQTPYLNELARDGIRFTHNMVTTSICWISRATLFTGQYASRHKSIRLRTTDFYNNWNTTTWPGILRNNGYHTGHIGKWQYMNPDHYVEKNLFDHVNLFEGVHWFRGKHMSDKARDDAITFLRGRPKDKPFAATVAFYPPKAVGMSFEPGAQWQPKPGTREKFYEKTYIPPPPYDVEESYKKLPWFFHTYEKEGRSRWAQRFNSTEKYQAAMKNYYSLVTEVDQAIRETVDELKQQGVYENTLIIFTTDNGLFHAEHGLAGKWYPYQESIRVPLIVRDPRMPKKRRKTLDDSLTLNIDLASTILGAAGIEPALRMQGRDIADIYLPPLKERDTIDPNDDSVTSAVDKNPWRTEFFYEFPSSADRIMPSNTAVVTHNLKYIYWPTYKYEQFFNLSADPLEQEDLVNRTEYASIIDGFRSRHTVYKDEVK